MAKFYDISAKITNELPTLKVMDGINVTINNRKSVVLCVQAMAREASNKVDEEDAEGQMKMMDKALNMLIGKKDTDAINALDLPIAEYSYIFSAIMKIAQGGEPDDEPDNTPS